MQFTEAKLLQRGLIMKIAIAAMAFLMCSIGAAAAQTSKAGDLADACNGRGGPGGVDICNAFINGFVNGVLVDQIATKGHDPICLPDQTNTDELRGIVKEFAAGHPQALTALAAPFLARALMQAYPCKK